MQHLSDRINRMSESETIAMSRRSRELSDQGVDVVNLSLGEPDFDTPDFIKESAKQAIDKGYSKYTPVPGYADLREAISRKFLRDNQLHYSPNQIVVSTGAKQSIANVVLSLVNPGDEVIIPAPYWVSYREIVRLAEGKTVYVEAGVETDFKISPAQLQAAITPQSRLMIFSSPCNPTGSVYTRQELEGFAAVLRQHPHVMVIADEIYEHIVFEGRNTSLGSLEGMANQVITVNGLSKGFAMTGWRLGYIGAPQWVADACNKMQGQFTSGTCSITQRAAITAVDADPTVIDPMKAAFKKRRDLVVELFTAIPGLKCNVPQGAFYLFPDVQHFLGKKAGDRLIATASDLSMYLLDEAHVATVGGEAFGAPNNIRLSYATSEAQLIKAAERIKTALQKIS
jgi:aspartate aminotransferase